jgi:hypothetical protein
MSESATATAPVAVNSWLFWLIMLGILSGLFGLFWLGGLF